VPVDVNVYLPTHNSRFQQPITGDPDKDRIGNRTKRVFNDPVGIKAARNTDRGFQQIYHRDTGEIMWDISSPIFVKGKHWGGFRIGFSLESINAAKKSLMIKLIIIMAAIILVSTILAFFTVRWALAPLKRLTATAMDLANGKNLEQEIVVTKQDEIGAMQEVLERLRLSMILALKRRKK